MITRFNNYIVESRKSLDELEMLNPEELGELLIDEIQNASPDVMYIQDLLTVGCPISARDKDGMTALDFAAFDEKLDMVKFLISKGADVNARSIMGSTAWDYANNNVRIACPELKPKK